jgi:hypothetical protein
MQKGEFSVDSGHGVFGATKAKGQMNKELKKILKTKSGTQTV